MLVEDLPMWGYVGDVPDDEFLYGQLTGTESILLFPHLHFKFGTNGDQIVSATIKTDLKKAVDLKDAQLEDEFGPVEFSYSVEFEENPELDWKDRMKVYTDSRFSASAAPEIHWLSIINSFVLVLLLTAFLAIILLRVLKNDFSTYMGIDEETMDEEEVSMYIILVCFSQSNSLSHRTQLLS
jgi:hypothetical protein